MKNYYARSDLAIETMTNALLNQDYRHKEKTVGPIHIETFDILKKSENYPHDIGKYVEMSFSSFEDLSSLAPLFQQQFLSLLKEKVHTVDPCILFVGLGNETLSCDSLGPSVLKHLRATHHYSLEERHEHHYFDTLCFIPGVKAYTGMETADLILCLCEKYHPDVIVAIDALCAQKYEKIGHVIQMNNVGIYPGSGIGNHRKSITYQTMGIPILTIGIPTVIHVSSLVSDVYYLLEGYFKESLDPSSSLKVGKRERYKGRLNEVQRRLILGEIGQLDEQKRIQLLNEVLDPLDNQFIMSDKAVDYDIEILSRFLSTSLNELTY